MGSQNTRFQCNYIYLLMNAPQMGITGNKDSLNGIYIRPFTVSEATFFVLKVACTGSLRVFRLSFLTFYTQ